MPTAIGCAFGALTTRLLMTCPRPVLVLLAAGGQVARLHARSAASAPCRAGPATRPTSCSYHRPTASSFFDQTASTRDRLAVLLGHQVVDGRELQHRVALERLLEEPLGHRRRPEQQRPHVQAQRPPPAAGPPA